MSQTSTTTSRIEAVPNPDAATALAEFLGEFRKGLIDKGFSSESAERIAEFNSKYIVENATITIVSEVSA